MILFFRKNNTGTPVPLRSRLYQGQNDWYNGAEKSGRYFHEQKSRRRDESQRQGSFLSHSFRGKRQSRDENKIHDRWCFAERSSER